MNRRQFALAGLIPTLWGSPVSGGPYLDSHTHTKKSESVGGSELIRRMDAAGIRKAYVLSTAYQQATDVERLKRPSVDERARVSSENDFTAAECAKNPDRLIPFLSVNPKRDYAIEEIDRCVDRHRMRGLKLHFWNSMLDTRQPAQLRQALRVIAHAAERGLPVIAHIFIGDVPAYGPDDTERFVTEIIAPLPSLKICLAHLSGAGGFAAPAQQCFERLITLCGPKSPMANRVWVDTAATIREATSAEDLQKMGQLLEHWGLHRTLWGSDSIADALEQTHANWPLSAAAWDTVRNNRGSAFLG